MQKKYELNMTTGNIWLLLIKFSIPLILSSMLQILFNAADVVVVGKFAGKAELAAVGSTGALTNLILGVALGISQGCNIVCSRAYGADDKKTMQGAVHSAIALSILCGGVVMLVGIFFSKPLLLLMGSPADVVDIAAVYMKIYFAGIIPILLYNFCSAILRAVGDTKRPFIFISIAGIINICLNLIFVIVFQIGAAGVALATVISWAITSILTLVVLIKSDSIYKVELKKIRFYPAETKKIVSLGLPMGIQGMTFSLSNVVIMSAINSLGTTVIAASSAAANIEGFVWVALEAVTIASMTFISQNYGAKNFERNDKGFNAGLVLVVIVSLFFGSLATIFGRQLLSLYTNDAQVVKYGLERLRIVALYYFLGGIMQHIVNAIKGYGKAIISTFLCLFGSCLLRLVWVWFVFPVRPTFAMLLYCYPITWIITSLICRICYIKIVKNIKKRHKALANQEL